MICSAWVMGGSGGVKPCPTDPFTGKPDAEGSGPARRGGRAEATAHWTGTVIVLIMSAGITISGNTYSTGIMAGFMTAGAVTGDAAGAGDKAEATAHSTGTVIVLIMSAGITISGNTYSTGTRTGPGAAPPLPVAVALAAGAGETPAVTVRVTAGAGSIAGGITSVSAPVTSAGDSQGEPAVDVAAAGLFPVRRLSRAGCLTPPGAVAPPVPVAGLGVMAGAVFRVAVVRAGVADAGAACLEAAGAGLSASGGV